MSAPASFRYCSELPPDIPPGLTLDEWRRLHARTHEAPRWHRPVALRRHRPWCAPDRQRGTHPRTDDHVI